MIGWQVFKTSVMITAFVAVMMIGIEYVNILSRGGWLRALAHSRPRQFALAVFLGAIPGCFGAFVLVALYSHRRITLGAVVAGMIATSGDEMFVMLALFPATALLLTLALMAVGLVAGWATDLFSRRPPVSRGEEPCEFAVHGVRECRCFPRGELIQQWRSPSPHRTTLAVGIGIFLLALVAGQVGPPEFDWRRASLLAASSFALFVILTVPDHFLDEHLWAHVAIKHVPRIFLWTLGVLAVLGFLDRCWDVAGIVASNSWEVLTLAVLVGIIPESGPHLLFVTLYNAGTLPLSILVASSVVQDGHGMLPLLADSRRDFLLVKAINVVAGAAVGVALMALGL